MAFAVIAKAPIPGRVKTRLCPPCTPAQAAAIAEGALRDTLAVVAATPATRRLCILDGAPGDWLPEGFEVVPQVGGGLDARLAAAFGGVTEPMFLVGMDTPQLTPELLDHAGNWLLRNGTDAVMGMTHDGGYWGIGLRDGRDPACFHGVPMSRDDTGDRQLDRLLDLGLAVDIGLPTLTDVDHMSEAMHVARVAPGGAFAQAVRAVSERAEVAA
ncbi:MAG: DUF2064 domain-containing protein [Patulibacter minatonensis]